jgi:O-glycosyl hydrolase
MSLAWEANVLYGSPFVAAFSTNAAFPGTYLDLLYGDPTTRLTLGLNVARYNIGGGDGAHRHMSPRAQMEGFQDGPGMPFDFTRDVAQRRLLQEVKARGANLFEAFSNSPPAWMTYSGCASGALDGGDNLDPLHDADFVGYLLATVSHFKAQEGVTFESLEPFNEPDGNWWKSGGSQEGYGAAHATQNRLIPKVAQALADAGLSTFVAAADANNRDHMTSALASYTALTLAGLGRINTHSYSGSNRWALSAETAQTQLPLWMSEVGCCLGTPKNVVGESDDHSDIWNALWMADNARLDLRDLKAEAWVFWQPDWNILSLNDGVTPVPKKAFYALAQYTNFIRPGFQIIAAEDNQTLAAFSPAAQRLVLVAVNWETASYVGYDLSAFAGLPAQLTVYRTTADASTNLTPQAGVSINAQGELIDTLPVRSVTTYVVDGVVPKSWLAGSTGLFSSPTSPGLCLGVAAAGPTSAPLALLACDAGTAGEVFTQDPVTGHFTVFSGAQEMCLNVWGGTDTNGARLGTWACNDGANERFSYDPTTGQVRVWPGAPGGNGSCLDVGHQPVDGGTGVFTYACASPEDGGQQFSLEPTP